ncbi:MAG TPA: GxxExxY protein [Methanocellaceae archaeon]|jgi:GxxExxY protein
MGEVQVLTREEPIPKRVEEVAALAVDAANSVRKEMGPCLLGSIYELCFLHELKKRELTVKTNVPMPVTYEGTRIEEGYHIGFLVEDCLVVEIHAVDRPAPDNEAYVLTRLRHSGYRIGLLIDFQTRRAGQFIKRVSL